MRLFLIPVADALAAVRAHFERWPHDDAPLSLEELRNLVDLTVRYVIISEALLQYAYVVGGKPSRS